MTENPEARIEAPSAVIAIGASAGGVEALSTLLAGVAPDLDAAILVVLHVSARGPSVLPAILSRVSGMPAAHAIDGEPLEARRIYVAPPDRHLGLDGLEVRVGDGPRENGVRPAIDVLFRSVARSYGERAIAVVLTGMLDDGTAGGQAVKRAGGQLLVQDPDEAMFRAMPASAATYGGADRVAPLHELAGILNELVRVHEASGERGPVDRDDDPASEVPSEFTCPDCGGTLFADVRRALPHFRCRVGHGYSPESLLVGKDAALEAALFAAVVSLEERADLTRRLSRRMDQLGSPSTERFRRQTRDAEEQADTIRALLAAIKHDGHHETVTW